MQKSKFSLGLDESDLQLLDKFIIYFNNQHLIALDRAKAIRILLRVGLKMQEMIPACHAEEVEWIHLAADLPTSSQNSQTTPPQRAICGVLNQQMVTLSLESQISCPKCMKAARHHASKTEKDL